jgi:hypothetical protein
MKNNYNNYNIMKMDTKIISLLTILAFNYSISFASDNVTFTETRPGERTIIQPAPSSPREAEFSDLVPEADASATIVMPVTPKEATFDDETCQESINDEQLLNALSPSTPKEAVFEDTI